MTSALDLLPPTRLVYFVTKDVLFGFFGLQLLELSRNLLGNILGFVAQRANTFRYLYLAHLEQGLSQKLNAHLRPVLHVGNI